MSPAERAAKKLKKAEEKAAKSKEAAKTTQRKAAKAKNSTISPSNTAGYHYFDRRAAKKKCKEDMQRIKDACNDKPDAEKNAKETAKTAKLGEKSSPLMRSLKATLQKGMGAIDGVGKSRSKYVQNDSNKWMANHCGSLWNKPGGMRGKKGEEVSNTQDFKNEIQGEVDKLITETADLEKVAKEKLMNFADDFAKEHVKDILDGAAEKAARRAAFMRMPAAQVWIARFSFWETMGTALGNTLAARFSGEMERRFEEVFKKVMDLNEKIGEYQRLLSSGLEDAMANTMSGIAYANPCIKARKCLLVPYKDAGNTKDGSGCCPGQTGHHPLPSSMFEQYQMKAAVSDKSKPSMESVGKRPCWSGYNHNEALTICLEGTTNHATNGSHGMAHQGTEAIVERFRSGTDMPYTTARDDIAQMLATAFGCDAKCIKAQLDDSLKDKHSCGNLNGANVTPHSGKSGGGPKVPDSSTGV